MRIFHRIPFLAFTSLALCGYIVAQTELMDDVDAIKENSDEDLYAPDDEAPASGSTSAAPPTPETSTSPPSPDSAAAENAGSGNPLDDLPIAGGDSRPDEALTGTSRATAELSSIRIYPVGNKTRFEIQTSRIVDYAPERSGSKFILNFANTNLGPLVSKGPINAREYGSPVSNIETSEDLSPSGTNARIVMNLTRASEPVIQRAGNRILVDFQNEGSGMDVSNNPRDIPSNYETLLSLNSKSNFIGTKVNFRAKDATVPDVLQFISQVSGKNFVLVGETEKKISMNVKRVPWDQVLALVLLNADLGYQKLGNTYRVMPVTKIRQEISDAVKAQEDEDKLTPKATELFPLSYSKTSEVIPQISKYLRTDLNENVVSDERTNSIVVTALPKNIQRIKRYIAAIDRQTPVVQVEARIVQAGKDFTRELGLHWKALGGFRIAGGDLFLGGALGEGSSTSTSSNSSAGGSTSTRSNFGKLGAQGGGFGTYTNENGTLRILDAFIKFNESKGGTRELSRPSLTVLNNKKATIIDGTEVTFLLSTGDSTSNDSGTTKTIKAALSLTVTPQVTNDNNILLNINLTRDSLAPSDPQTVNVAKREINTETLVESGATVVIGGVYIKEESSTEAGWPFFRKVPILGRLFTSTDSTKENERELLMFISPRILNKERAAVFQQSLEEAR